MSNARIYSNLTNVVFAIEKDTLKWILVIDEVNGIQSSLKFLHF